MEIDRQRRHAMGDTAGCRPAAGRLARALLLLGTFVVAATGCGAPFAPPMRGATMGVAAPGGQTEAAFHGVLTRQGAWEAEMRVPLGSHDDVEVTLFGHEFAGDNEEAFTMPAVGWRHRVPVHPKLQLATGVGAGLGFGGHGRNWPENAVHLAGGGYFDGGATWIPLDWLRLYSMVRLQQSFGLTSPIDPEHPDQRLERAPPTSWVSVALGSRFDVGTAFFGAGMQWSWGYAGQQRIDASGLTASAGWRF